MTTSERARPTGVETPSDPADSPSISRRIRDHAFVLENALRLVRLSAGGNPLSTDALEMADRQVKALVALADELHGPA